jgi:plastocyanin
MRAFAMLLLLAFLTAGCASDDSDTDSTDGTGTSTTTSDGNTTVSVSVSVSGTSTGAPPGNGTVSKTITDDDFPDGDFTIKRGQAVNWTHMGTNPHSVTGGVFDSSPGCSSATPEACLKSGESYEFTFQAAGTYPYNCKVHPTTMTGTITVTE